MGSDITSTQVKRDLNLPEFNNKMRKQKHRLLIRIQSMLFAATISKAFTFRTASIACIYYYRFPANIQEIYHVFDRPRVPLYT